MNIWIRTETCEELLSKSITTIVTQNEKGVNRGKLKIQPVVSKIEYDVAMTWILKCGKMIFNRS